MIKVKITCFVFFLIIACPLIVKSQEKLRRSESFFGFHFDFHATAKDTALGKNFDTALLDTFLLRTKPDFIQVDSKGHPGYSSYPTKIGFSANSFVKDPMRIWRNVTNKYNIALYVHYSGLLDTKAIHEHPEWGRINPDGSVDPAKAAYLGAYSDKLLIPQLEELIDTYDIDGAWIDGDCWASAPDYSPSVIAGFLKETGLKDVPRVKDDPDYKTWLDYNRLMFKNYLKHYVNKIHAYKPGFQIASNWAYSSMMPEKVDVDVDFLSGDVSGRNCVYSAAFQARCLALQGKPWDLMSWGMTPVDFWGGIYSRKSLVQLQQEAAEVMAMGGGFQVYFQQNRDASFRTLDVSAMGELADFCRARQPFCQYSEIIPQIGIWYSLEGWKKQNDGVYGWSSDMEGLTSLLLDCQYSAEILMDHTIRGRMDKYPIIIIPEWSAFDTKIKSQLLDYAREGGNVLIVGAKAVKEFQEILNADFIDGDTSTLLLMGDRDLGGITGLKTLWQPVSPNAGTQVVGHVYSQDDYRYATKYPIATINNYGKGKIAAVYMNISTAYTQYRDPVFNKLFTQIIQILVPGSRLLHVTGSDKVHVVLGKKKGNTLIHLINSAGEHANKNVLVYDELRPTPPLLIRLKADHKPKAVKLQPEGKELDFRYQNNSIEILIPPVKVYSIIEIIPH